jgi:regulator of chromosome condensation
MARASRSASAKPAEKKDATEVKVNGTGTSRPPQVIIPLLRDVAASRRGAKKTEDAPVANGIAEEDEDVEMADADAKEVEASLPIRTLTRPKQSQLLIIL